GVGRQEHPRRPDRSRQGARDVRLDRRQLAARADRPRLRYRRHPLHARIEGSRRQVRGPQRAVRRPGARRGTADVRKVMLEEPPGNRAADDEMVARARQRLFGSWEMNWIAFNFAHDVSLPGSAGAPLPFLMYPQAETDRGRIDCLDPDRFRYEITAREIAV